MVQYNKEKLFEKARLDICCNTSYPYRRGYFGGYLTDMDIMKEVSELSLYFHIPFCKLLCRFCEYTRFIHSLSTAEKNDTTICWILNVKI
jgi:coproporphyrinogen III oxidase-like Fe-S oxidoreductase